MSQGFDVLFPTRDTEIQEKIFKDNHYKIPPASFFDEYSPADIRGFGVKSALYTIPTLELIEFLRPWVMGKRAVEICAGYGIIGQALGIPVTDSFMQERSDIALAYAIAMQPVIRYPKEVIKIDANEVIKYYKPEVVIGSFVTATEDMHGHPLNMYGVREDLFLDDVETYIMIGNENVHGTKKIRTRPHRVYKADWLVSKAAKPEANMIYIWSKNFVELDSEKYKFTMYETEIDPAKMPESATQDDNKMIENLLKSILGDIS